jgi:heat shock protein HtpX
MGHAELFPRDRGLVAQMMVVSVLTPLLTIGLTIAAFLMLPICICAGLGFSLAAGIVLVARDRTRVPAAAPTTPAEAPDLIALVNRLCVLADVAAPEVVIERERHPNSWLVELPGRPARLHVTRALLNLLDGDELAAVIAHELSHLANRDAMVMTVVGMPGMVISGGTGRCVGGVGGAIASLIGALSAIGTSSLSRCRELAADRGACAITGRPSALASALLKVSGQIAAAPREDLRTAALRDSFHLVAVGPPTAWYGSFPFWHRLGATHPTLERRLAALEALEHSVQHARLTLDR